MNALDAGPVPMNSWVPETISCVLWLEAVSATSSGLPDWKSFSVTVTFAGTLFADKVEVRSAGKTIKLPPVATPPDMVRVPPKRPCPCNVWIRLVTAGSVRSKLGSNVVAAVPPIVTPPPRVIAFAGRVPVLKTTNPPLALIAFVGAEALTPLFPK
jgi:hypothetical protein